MTKYKVSELEGALLDAAVVAAEGRKFDLHLMDPHGVDFITVVDHEQSGWVSWSPSRIWSDGGPIIERERITIVASTGYDGDEPLVWCAYANGPFHHYIDERLPGCERETFPSDSPLKSAMRAYVASKLGEEVEL